MPNAVYQSAGGLRLHRVQQAHRDIGVAGRQDAGGVQDLRAEIRQLGGFVKVKMAHGRCILHHTGVVVVHSVDVCPDLDFFRPGDGADDAGRIVRPSPPEVVHLSAGVQADIALGDVQIRLFFLLQNLIQGNLDALHIGLRQGVGTHKGKGRKELGVYAFLLEESGHHTGGHQLSLGEDDALLDVSEGLFRDIGQLLENAVYICLGLGLAFRFGIQFLDYAVVFAMQGGDGVPGSVLVVIGQIAGNFHQRIGSPGHGREYYYILLPGSNNAGHFLKTLRTAHRRATELQYLHFGPTKNNSILTAAK